MFRGRVTLPTHAAIELLTAFVLMAVPLAIGLPLDAVITAGVAGVILFGLAVSATETEGRGTLPLSAHATYDSAIALVLIGAALVFGVAGEKGALAFLFAAGIAQLVLNSVTRYTPASR